MSKLNYLSDDTWMSRCYDLAKRGLGHVSPNPPVGAVLVYQNRILSEGYHPNFGGPHAEVETIRNVTEKDRHFIKDSILYVSLEPCCITGKTPPCTDLIIREGIRDVRIGTLDPNPLIAGKGITQLQSQGIKVTTAILEEEGRQLIRSFRTNILLNRPHVVLKWAQSHLGYMGLKEEKIWLSHPSTNIWTHRKRAETDAIMVGARTVLSDDPSLTTRDYPGRSPHRVVYDPNGKLDSSFKVFNDDGCKVFYFSNAERHCITGSHVIQSIQAKDTNHVECMLSVLFEHQIGNVLIEGGAYLLQQFIDRDAWDEAWVIRTAHSLDRGIKAPIVHGRLLDQFRSESDMVIGIKRNENPEMSSLNPA